MYKVIFCVLLFFLNFNLSNRSAQYGSPESWNFDSQLEKYFDSETKRLTELTAHKLQAITDWESFRHRAVIQARDMLGLNPWPEKTPLEVTITGVIEHDDFIVEKLHFQSMPGLYVTGNLYRPKNIDVPVPAVLYVCGHANIKENGISYGSKTVYQHHPAWFARHGYICLILDTMQLGEIEGIHHGLHRYDRWWWMCRGYTPAGVEAWNGIRAIDYLTGRPDVDPDRIGITGRSGGGATSWWIAALDDRVKAAVPVAGITDLTNHVIDGCVDGHCDCMYFVNTYGWDYSMLASLIAPRPLLISNTDRDPIFPLDGVYRTYVQVRKVYEMLGMPDNLALNIAAGPHMDIQPLRIHAFQWFDKFLLDRDELIEKTAVKYFTPQQLKVFDVIPDDEINARIDELFVPPAPSTTELLENTSWASARQSWFHSLEKYVFAGWPGDKPAPILDHIETVKWQNRECSMWRLTTDAYTHLPLIRIKNQTTATGLARVYILDDANWADWSALLGTPFTTNVPWASQSGNPDNLKRLQESLKETEDCILIPMRGAGPARFSGDGLNQTQIQRRYYLLGQTLHGMQTWDILQGIRAVQNMTRSDDLKGEVRYIAEGTTAVMLAYASLFTEMALQLQLDNPTLSHHDGPYYLNVLRHMDIPAAIMMAAKKHYVTICTDSVDSWRHLDDLGNQIPGIHLVVSKFR